MTNLFGRTCSQNELEFFRLVCRCLKIDLQEYHSLPILVEISCLTHDLFSFRLNGHSVALFIECENQIAFSINAIRYMTFTGGSFYDAAKCKVDKIRNQECVQIAWYISSEIIKVLDQLPLNEISNDTWLQDGF